MRHRLYSTNFVYSIFMTSWYTQFLSILFGLVRNFYPSGLVRNFAWRCGSFISRLPLFHFSFATPSVLSRLSRLVSSLFVLSLPCHCLVIVLSLSCHCLVVILSLSTRNWPPPNLTIRRRGRALHSTFKEPRAWLWEPKLCIAIYSLHGADRSKRVLI